MDGPFKVIEKQKVLDVYPQQAVLSGLIYMAKRATLVHTKEIPV